MTNDFLLLNFIFFFFFLLLLTKSWGYVGTLLIVEVMWVLLYCLFINVAPVAYDLSPFMVAILILVLSAVELVLGLLCFVIFYHTTNATSLQGTSGNKLLSLYAKGFSNLKLEVKKFF